MSLLVYSSTVLDQPCVRLTSSVGRASERKSEGRGFEFLMRLTLYLESKNLSTAVSIIYIYIYIGLIERDGGLSTLYHSYGFACQQRMLITFLGPGYLHPEDGVASLCHYINIYIHICAYI